MRMRTGPEREGGIYRPPDPGVNPGTPGIRTRCMFLPTSLPQHRSPPLGPFRELHNESPASMSEKYPTAG